MAYPIVVRYLRRKLLVQNGELIAEIESFARNNLPQEMRNEHCVQKCVCAACKLCKPWSHGSRRCQNREKCEERRKKGGAGFFQPRTSLGVAGLKTDALAYVKSGMMV
jgi:NAD-dependent DNA ligase